MTNCGAQSANQVKEKKSLCPPKRFKDLPKHPKSKHVKENVSKSPMRKHVRNNLVRLELGEHYWVQHQLVRKSDRIIKSHLRQEYHHVQYN